MNTNREWDRESTRIETRMNANHGMADKHRWTQIRLGLSAAICSDSTELDTDFPGSRLAFR